MLNKRTETCEIARIKPEEGTTDGTDAHGRKHFPPKTIPAIREIRGQHHPKPTVFPDSSTARKVGLRDFEFITISTDDPKESAKAKAFLERRGAGLLDRLTPSLKAAGRTTNNYIFSDPDTNALVKALDPEWPGVIPQTVLVGTKGEIIWRHTGAVNGVELRETMLGHIGPVLPALKGMPAPANPLPR